jgi:polar amino acid transport system permease protein
MAEARATLGGLGKRKEARAPGLSYRARKALSYAAITVIVVATFIAFQFDTDFMRLWFPYIVGGVTYTLILSFGGIALAIPLALFGALGRLSRSAVLESISGFYVSFFRGTPLLVQVFFIYYALPQLAFKPGVPAFLEPILVLDIIFAGILALGLNYGAYMTEIFRAGIQSIGHGQVEAAHALAMTPRQTMRRIVLPQALRVIIPPAGNDFIAMLKDSSLVGVAGSVTELFNRAQTTGRAEVHPFEALALAALIYWLLTGVFTFFQTRLERRVGRGHVRETVHGH